jgi:hypothetical protein
MPSLLCPALSMHQLFKISAVVSTALCVVHFFVQYVWRDNFISLFLIFHFCLGVLAVFLRLNKQSDASKVNRWFFLIPAVYGLSAIASAFIAFQEIEKLAACVWTIVFMLAINSVGLAIVLFLEKSVKDRNFWIKFCVVVPLFGFLFWQFNRKQP